MDYISKNSYINASLLYNQAISLESTTIIRLAHPHRVVAAQLLNVEKH